MSSVALGPSKIEGRIWPRTQVDEGGRYLGIPPSGAFQHSPVSRKPGAVHWRLTFSEFFFRRASSHSIGQRAIDTTGTTARSWNLSYFSHRFIE